MRLSPKSLLILVAVVAVFASCKKSVPKQVKYIPKDATFVLGINTRSLYEKAGKSNISLDSVFNTFSKEAADPDVTKMKNAVGDLKDAGIDFSEQIYLFVKAGGSIMNGKSVSMATIALLKDASKFEAYLRKQKADVSIKKEAKYSYAALGNDFVAGWSSDVAIISNVSGGRNAPGSYSSGEGTLSQAQLTTLFEQKDEESAASISEFRDLVKEKADAFFWSNSSSIFDQVPMLGMTKVSDLFKDTYTAGTINFEDGKIVADTKSYSSKALQDIIKKHPSQDLDFKMITQYPSSNIDGFISFSFNPELLIDILKYSGFDGQANQFLGDLGFTIEDVAKAFKGDVAAVVSDLTVVTKPNPYYPAATTKQPEVKFIFNAKVGDKASYDKVMGALEKKGLVSKSGNEYRITSFNVGVPYSIDDKNILVGLDSTVLQSYKAGNGKADLPDDIKSKSSGQAMSAFIDISKILTAIPLDSGAKAEEVALMDKAKATFKNISATSGHFDGKLSKSEIELKFVDDKKNSLVNLLEFFAAAAKTAKIAHNDDAVIMDSAVPPVVDSVPAPPAEQK